MIQNDTTSWIYANEALPDEDKDYLTAIRYADDRIVVEIAPWRNGTYQGAQKMAVYFNSATVVCWMNIPAIDMSRINELCFEDDILI